VFPVAAIKKEETAQNMFALFLISRLF